MLKHFKLKNKTRSRCNFSPIAVKKKKKIQTFIYF